MRPFRSFRSRHLPNLIVVDAAACAACSGLHLRQHELPLGSLAPIDRPEVYLYVDQLPREPEGSDGLRFELPLESAGYQSMREDDGSREDMTYTLDFRAETDRGMPPAPLHRVAIRALERMVPSLDRQQVYRAAFFYRPRGMFLPPAQGVAIQDQDGRLLYLLSADEAVPASYLPAGMSLLPSRRTAFVSTRVTPSGCTIYKRHHFVEARLGEKAYMFSPGEERVLDTAAGTYSVTLFDYSVSDTEMECLAEDPPHFSLLIRAVDSP